MRRRGRLERLANRGHGDLFGDLAQLQLQVADGRAPVGEHNVARPCDALEPL